MDYNIADILVEYGIGKKALKAYLKKNKIPIIRDSRFNEKYFQTVLSFIESTEGRIENKLEKSTSNF